CRALWFLQPDAFTRRPPAEVWWMGPCLQRSGRRDPRERCSACRSGAAPGTDLPTESRAPQRPKKRRLRTISGTSTGSMVSRELPKRPIGATPRTTMQRRTFLAASACVAAAGGPLAYLFARREPPSSSLVPDPQSLL